LALLHLLCCSPAGNQRPAFSPLLSYINNTYSFVSSV
jgi:xyloglucan O-acetyltransferase